MIIRSQQRTRWIRGIALALALMQVAEAPLWASGSSQRSTPEIQRYSVPENLGLLQRPHQGTQDLTILTIQDIHENQSAQRAIAELLTNLTDHYGIRTIAVEGSTGEVDLSLFRSFSDTKVRQAAADRMVAQGHLSGAELFAAVREQGVALYGVDDQELYWKNLAAFKDLLEKKSHRLRTLDSIRDAIRLLEDRAYSPELLQLERKGILNTKASEPFERRWARLHELGASAGVDLERFSSLNDLASAVLAGKEVDFKAAGEERGRLLDELTRASDPASLEQLLRQAVEFKAGRISQGSFSTFLIDTAVRHGITVDGYPELQKAAAYFSGYEKVDFDLVRRDAREAEDLIREALFTDKDQRRIHRARRHVELLGDLFEVRLAAEGLDVFRKDGMLRSDAYVRELEGLCKAFEVPVPSAEAVVQLHQEIPDALEFFDLAEARNERMLKNMVDRMRKDGTRVGVLVTGGFHAKGMAPLMQQQDISHVLILPRFETKATRPYWSLVAQSPTSLREYLESPELVGARYEALGTMIAAQLHPMVLKSGEAGVSSDVLTGAAKESLSRIADRQTAASAAPSSDVLIPPAAVGVNAGGAVRPARAEKGGNSEHLGLAPGNWGLVTRTDEEGLRSVEAQALSDGNYIFKVRFAVPGAELEVTVVVDRETQIVRSRHTIDQTGEALKAPIAEPSSLIEEESEVAVLEREIVHEHAQSIAGKKAPGFYTRWIAPLLEEGFFRGGILAGAASALDVSLGGVISAGLAVGQAVVFAASHFWAARSEARAQGRSLTFAEFAGTWRSGRFGQHLNFGLVTGGLVVTAAVLAGPAGAIAGWAASWVLHTLVNQQRFIGVSGVAGRILGRLGLKVTQDLTVGSHGVATGGIFQSLLNRGAIVVTDQQERRDALMRRLAERGLTAGVDYLVMTGGEFARAVDEAAAELIALTEREASPAAKRVLRDLRAEFGAGAKLGALNSEQAEAFLSRYEDRELPPSLRALRDLVQSANTVQASALSGRRSDIRDQAAQRALAALQRASRMLSDRSRSIGDIWLEVDIAVKQLRGTASERNGAMTDFLTAAARYGRLNELLELFERFHQLAEQGERTSTADLLTMQEFMAQLVMLEQVLKDAVREPQNALYAALRDQVAGPASARALNDLRRMNGDARGAPYVIVAAGERIRKVHRLITPEPKAKPGQDKAPATLAKQLLRSKESQRQTRNDSMKPEDALELAQAHHEAALLFDSKLKEFRGDVQKARAALNAFVQARGEALRSRGIKSPIHLPYLTQDNDRTRTFTAEDWARLASVQVQVTDMAVRSTAAQLEAANGKMTQDQLLDTMKKLDAEFARLHEAHRSLMDIVYLGEAAKAVRLRENTHRPDAAQLDEFTSGFFAEYTGQGMTYLTAVSHDKLFKLETQLRLWSASGRPADGSGNAEAEAALMAIRTQIQDLQALLPGLNGPSGETAQERHLRIISQMGPNIDRINSLVRSIHDQVEALSLDPGRVQGQAIVRQIGEAADLLKNIREDFLTPWVMHQGARNPDAESVIVPHDAVRGILNESGISDQEAEALARMSASVYTEMLHMEFGKGDAFYVQKGQMGFMLNVARHVQQMLDGVEGSEDRVKALLLQAGGGKEAAFAGGVLTGLLLHYQASQGTPLIAPDGRLNETAIRRALGDATSSGARLKKVFMMIGENADNLIDQMKGNVLINFAARMGMPVWIVKDKAVYRLDHETGREEMDATGKQPLDYRSDATKDEAYWKQQGGIFLSTAKSLKHLLAEAESPENPSAVSRAILDQVDAGVADEIHAILNGTPLILGMGKGEFESLAVSDPLRALHIIRQNMVLWKVYENVVRLAVQGGEDGTLNHGMPVRSKAVREIGRGRFTLDDTHLKALYEQLKKTDGWQEVFGDGATQESKGAEEAFRFLVEAATSVALTTERDLELSLDAAGRYIVRDRNNGTPQKDTVLGSKYDSVFATMKAVAAYEDHHNGLRISDIYGSDRFLHYLMPVGDAALHHTSFSVNSSRLITYLGASKFITGTATMSGIFDSLPTIGVQGVSEMTPEDDLDELGVELRAFASASQQDQAIKDILKRSLLEDNKDAVLLTDTSNPLLQKWWDRLVAGAARGDAESLQLLGSMVAEGKSIQVYMLIRGENGEEKTAVTARVTNLGNGRFKVEGVRQMSFGEAQAAARNQLKERVKDPKNKPQIVILGQGINEGSNILGVPRATSSMILTQPLPYDVLVQTSRRINTTQRAKGTFHQLVNLEEHDRLTEREREELFKLLDKPAEAQALLKNFQKRMLGERAHGTVSIIQSDQAKIGGGSLAETRARGAVQRLVMSDQSLDDSVMREAPADMAQLEESLKVHLQKERTPARLIRALLPPDDEEPLLRALLEPGSRRPLTPEGRYVIHQALRLLNHQHSPAFLKDVLTPLLEWLKASGYETAAVQELIEQVGRGEGLSVHDALVLTRQFHRAGLIRLDVSWRGMEYLEERLMPLIRIAQSRGQHLTVEEMLSVASARSIHEAGDEELRQDPLAGMERIRALHRLLGATDEEADKAAAALERDPDAVAKLRKDRELMGRTAEEIAKAQREINDAFLGGKTDGELADRRAALEKKREQLRMMQVQVAAALEMIFPGLSKMDSKSASEQAERWELFLKAAGILDPSIRRSGSALSAADIQGLLRHRRTFGDVEALHREVLPKLWQKHAASLAQPQTEDDARQHQANLELARRRLWQEMLALAKPASAKVDISAQEASDYAERGEEIWRASEAFSAAHAHQDAATEEDLIVGAEEFADLDARTARRLIDVILPWADQLRKGGSFTVEQLTVLLNEAGLDPELYLDRVISALYGSEAADAPLTESVIQEYREKGGLEDYFLIRSGQFTAQKLKGMEAQEKAQMFDVLRKISPEKWAETEAHFKMLSRLSAIRAKRQALQSLHPRIAFETSARELAAGSEDSWLSDLPTNPYLGTSLNLLTDLMLLASGNMSLDGLIQAVADRVRSDLGFLTAANMDENFLKVIQSKLEPYYRAYQVGHPTRTDQDYQHLVRAIAQYMVLSYEIQAGVGEVGYDDTLLSLDERQDAALERVDRMLVQAGSSAAVAEDIGTSTEIGWHRVGPGAVNVIYDKKLGVFYHRIGDTDSFVTTGRRALHARSASDPSDAEFKEAHAAELGANGVKEWDELRGNMLTGTDEKGQPVEAARFAAVRVVTPAQTMAYEKNSQRKTEWILERGEKDVWAAVSELERLEAMRASNPSIPGIDARLRAAEENLKAKTEALHRLSSGINIPAADRYEGRELPVWLYHPDKYRMDSMFMQTARTMMRQFHAANARRLESIRRYNTDLDFYELGYVSIYQDTTPTRSDYAQNKDYKTTGDGGAGNLIRWLDENGFFEDELRGMSVEDRDRALGEKIGRVRDAKSIQEALEKLGLDRQDKTVSAVRARFGDRMPKFEFEIGISDSLIEKIMFILFDGGERAEEHAMQMAWTAVTHETGHSPLVGGNVDDHAFRLDVRDEKRAMYATLSVFAFTLERELPEDEEGLRQTWLEIESAILTRPQAAAAFLEHLRVRGTLSAAKARKLETGLQTEDGRSKVLSLVRGLWEKGDLSASADDTSSRRSLEDTRRVLAAFARVPTMEGGAAAYTSRNTNEIYEPIANLNLIGRNRLEMIRNYASNIYVRSYAANPIKYLQNEASIEADVRQEVLGMPEFKSMSAAEVEEVVAEFINIHRDLHGRTVGGRRSVMPEDSGVAGRYRKAVELLKRSAQLLEQDEITEDDAREALAKYDAAVRILGETGHLEDASELASRVRGRMLLFADQILGARAPGAPAMDRAWIRMAQRFRRVPVPGAVEGLHLMTAFYISLARLATGVLVDATLNAREAKASYGEARKLAEALRQGRWKDVESGARELVSERGVRSRKARRLADVLAKETEIAEIMGKSGGDRKTLMEMRKLLEEGPLAGDPQRGVRPDAERRLIVIDEALRRLDQRRASAKGARLAGSDKPLPRTEAYLLQERAEILVQTAMSKLNNDRPQAREAVLTLAADLARLQKAGSGLPPDQEDELYRDDLFADLWRLYGAFAQSTDKEDIEFAEKVRTQTFFHKMLLYHQQPLLFREASWKTSAVKGRPAADIDPDSDILFERKAYGESVVLRRLNGSDGRAERWSQALGELTMDRSYYLMMLVNDRGVEVPHALVSLPAGEGKKADPDPVFIGYVSLEGQVALSEKQLIRHFEHPLSAVAKLSDKIDASKKGNSSQQAILWQLLGETNAALGEEISRRFGRIRGSEIMGDPSRIKSFKDRDKIAASEIQDYYKKNAGDAFFAAAQRNGYSWSDLERILGKDWSVEFSEEPGDPRKPAVDMSVMMMGDDGALILPEKAGYLKKGLNSVQLNMAVKFTREGASEAEYLAHQMMVQVDHKPILDLASPDLVTSSDERLADLAALRSSMIAEQLERQERRATDTGPAGLGSGLQALRGRALAKGFDVPGLSDRRQAPMTHYLGVSKKIGSAFRGPDQKAPVSAMSDGSGYTAGNIIVPSIKPQDAKGSADFAASQNSYAVFGGKSYRTGVRPLKIGGILKPGSVSGARMASSAVREIETLMMHLPRNSAGWSPARLEEAVRRTIDRLPQLEAYEVDADLERALGSASQRIQRVPAEVVNSAALSADAGRTAAGPEWLRALYTDDEWAAHAEQMESGALRAAAGVLEVISQPGREALRLVIPAAALVRDGRLDPASVKFMMALSAKRERFGLYTRTQEEENMITSSPELSMWRTRLHGAQQAGAETFREAFGWQEEHRVAVAGVPELFDGWVPAPLSVRPALLPPDSFSEEGASPFIGPAEAVILAIQASDLEDGVVQAGDSEFYKMDSVWNRLTALPGIRFQIAHLPFLLKQALSRLLQSRQTTSVSA